jgi:FlaA1/EpsC-like NDP-sugar epimerase
MPRSYVAKAFATIFNRLGRAVERLPRALFSRWMQMVVDACLSAVSIWCAYQLRFDFRVPPEHIRVMVAWALALFFLRPLSLLLCGEYKSIWRYYNLADAVTLFRGTLPVAAVMLIVREWYLIWHRLLPPALPPGLIVFLNREGVTRYVWFAGIPRAAIVIDYCLFVLLALGVRSTRRVLNEAARRPSARRPTLLVGSEVGLASALRQVTLFPDVSIAGLLTEETRLHGSRISRIPVLGSPAGLETHLAKGQIDLVLIADEDVDSIGRTIATTMDFGVEARLLPAAAHIVSGNIRASTTAKPELAINPSGAPGQPHSGVVESFRSRTVLITGAGGSIGSEISRQVNRLPAARVLLLDQDENSIFEIHNELLAAGGNSAAGLVPRLVPLVADIRDPGRIWSIFSKYRPEIILHAAAYKHVPVMEYNCSEAVLNNVIGTRCVAEAARRFGAERFLMISTDKAVNPSSMMGATKRVAELIVQHLASSPEGSGSAELPSLFASVAGAEAGLEHGPQPLAGGRPAQPEPPALTRYACVRFGNVMGSRGSVVPLFLRQIAAGGPLTITDAEMTRYFMTIPEAVQLVLQAATLGSNGEIYMLDMGDPVRITTLARRLIEMSGLRPGEDIEIRFVGTRPGEKLREQLWSDSAKVTPTSFARVLSIEPAPPPERFPERLAALERAALAYDDELTRIVMRQMPISYHDEESVRAVASNQ